MPQHPEDDHLQAEGVGDAPDQEAEPVAYDCI